MLKAIVYFMIYMPSDEDWLAHLTDGNEDKLGVLRSKWHYCKKIFGAPHGFAVFVKNELTDTERKKLEEYIIRREYGSKTNV
jgi:hypothetical protein